MPKMNDPVAVFRAGYDLNDNMPNHWMFSKKYWHSRNKNPQNVEVLESIIEMGFDILIRKVCGGSIDFENEASMQMQFGLILSTIGKLFESKQNDKFHLDLESPIELKTISAKSGTKNAHIDVVLCFGNRSFFSTAAIELKFFRKKNHREPNNRYDAFSDISNLEKYKKEYFDLCYFFALTDHDHYVNKESYSKKTGDFDLRDGKEYKAGTLLSYRTPKPYGEPLTLEDNYLFKWKTAIMVDIRDFKAKAIYSLMVKC